ncbi:mitochondrial fission ELM1 family protein [Magnetovirga frankeli]|uniref:mitochondrial fission ELM1 family protein n=1 Tax=Magnetovirga frankeli TaxID=947516 RepID=UPI001293A6C8|nr:mitochondrial fission ELM1 family protein [gamma proteobacterium SS-5]
MSPTPPKPWVIWRFIDGKPGHENQSLGLVQALQRLGRFVCQDISVASGLLGGLGQLRTEAARLAPPHLLIGAGHGTHLPLLLARWRYGGRSLVLMRPSLPLGWFDLCLIPQHDNPPASARILPTLGALNSIQPSRQQDMRQGLILLGGPSPHFHWDSQQLLRQIGLLLAQNPQVQYRLSDSRRTPSDLLPLLAARQATNLSLIPHRDTGPGWVNQALAECGQVWVSMDSVSMIYEALSAGCAVGVLPLTPRGQGRLSRGLQPLLQQQRLCLFDEQGGYLGQLRPTEPLQEANRCAQYIIQRWRLGDGE